MKSIYLIIVLLACMYANAQCPNDCSGHGFCKISNVSAVCQCEPEYAKLDCSYVRKSKSTAEGLEWGLGFFGIAGAGRLYLGYTIFGLFHLLASLFFCCGCCCMTVKIKREGKSAEQIQKETNAVMCCLFTVWCMYAVAMFVWYIVEGAIISGGIPDVNGIEMGP